MGDTWANPGVLRIAAAVFLALVAGTAVRLIALRGATRDIVKRRIGSLLTWWLLAVLLFAAAFLGRAGAAILFVLISGLAFHEFSRLSRGTEFAPRLRFAVYVLLPLNYLWIWLDRPHTFQIFLPLTVPMLASLMWIIAGRSRGFLREVGRVFLAALLTVYFPAHAALLFTLSPASNPVAGLAGWFLFLVLLTELNDISQALIGRRWGQRRIAPRLSPNKTWGGFLGGLAVTATLALALAPWATPLSALEAAAAGILIALAGFCGDLTMSAVKRDAGVSDSSRLLPGQGGVLDRIDSLMFSAPLFYYYVSWTL